MVLKLLLRYSCDICFSLVADFGSLELGLGKKLYLCRNIGIATTYIR